MAAKRFVYLLTTTILVFSSIVSSDNSELAKIVESPQEITVLEPRIAVNREIAGGQNHTYQFALIEGQYAKIHIVQYEVDLVVRLFGIDGKLITEIDSDIRLKGEEIVELVAASGGAYKLEIESKNKAGLVGRVEIRWTELRAATSEDHKLEEARKMIQQTNLLEDEDKLEEALPLAEHALAIREEILGTDHLEVAQALHMICNLEFQMDNYDRAELFCEKALAIREKTLSANHPDIANTLARLGTVYFENGRYSKAKLLYHRALEIREQSFGTDHPEVGRSVNQLGNYYFHTWDFVQAELLYRRWVGIAEKSFGENHPTFAKALGNLANVYAQLGDFAKAKPMLLRSMEILEKAYGPDNPDISPGLIMIGNLYSNMGQHSKAADYFQRALSLMEKEGVTDYGLTVALENLGKVYVAQGEYVKAEPLIQRALARLEELLGSEHFKVAGCINSLADLYLAIGDYSKAEDLYRRAAEIFEKSFGPDYQELATSFRGLAVLYWVKGDIPKSVSCQARANDIIERNTAYNLIAGSERQKMDYLASLAEETERTISLHIELAPNFLEAKRLGALAVLQRKGRVLNWMTDTFAVLRSRFKVEDQLLLDELNETLTHLANLVINAPERMSLVQYQHKIQVLEDKKERLENEISHRSAGFYQPSQPVDIATIQEAIPASAALLEFAIYRPFNPKEPNKKKAFGKPRYVVYVLRRDEVNWKDLGEVETIDAAIDAFREALRNPKRNDILQVARLADEKIMKSVRPLFGDATQLFISPDGVLNLIPFEAFLDEKNQYLVERYSFTYLTSGRDLLRSNVAPKSNTDLLVLADPLFGEPERKVLAETRVPKSKQNVEAKRKSVTTGSNLLEVYFAPLMGTAQEADSIKSLFPQGNVLTGVDATEAALKQVRAPSILHIATHGFFLTDTKIQNPLLRSGLAFAGANVRKSGAEDGILTALEASGLNLWGTKLVCLSACDTGLGEVKNGEGIYGLRRAFLLAGTETLVMSLWPVSDYITRELMTSYYKGLTKELGRGEALRQVQLNMLKRKGRKHPFYWASFIQSGEWANLNGKR